MLKFLFILVLALKIGASLYAFTLGFNQTAQPITGFSTLIDDPIWLWSFTLPLLFMATYVIAGWLMVNKRPKKELFAYADSCYYLGFLFTIASIIITLASIQDENFSVSEIAIRFAAAMLTTFIGMAVRLFYITFNSDERGTLKFLLSNFGPTTGIPTEGITKDAYQASEDTPSGSQNGAPDQRDFPQLVPSKAQTVDSEDDLNFILQVSCQNLAILNNQLVESINKFSHLVDLMLDSIARLGHDIEVESDKMKTFNEDIQKNTKEVLMQTSNDFSANLSQHLTAFKTASETISQNIVKESETNSQIFKEALSQAQFVFTENLSQQQQALRQTSDQLTEHLKKQIGFYSSSINDFSDNLSRHLTAYTTTSETLSQNAVKESETNIHRFNEALSQAQFIFMENLSQQQQALRQTSDLLSEHLRKQIERYSSSIVDIHSDRQKAAEDYAVVLDNQLKGFAEATAKVIDNIHDQFTASANDFAQKLSGINPSIDTTSLQAELEKYANTLDREIKNLEEITQTQAQNAEKFTSWAVSGSLQSQIIQKELEDAAEQVRQLSSKFKETGKIVLQLNNELQETSSNFFRSLEKINSEISEEFRQKKQNFSSKGFTFFDRFRR